MTHEEKDKLIADKDAQIAELMTQLEAKNSADSKVNADKDALIAELKAKLEAKTVGADATVPEEKKTVRLHLYKDERINEDVQVFVNGRQYIIQRGVDVEVPLEVAEVLKNQERMKAQIADYNKKHADKN